MSGEISKKQLEANKENAKLGGVKTLNGKEISKYNAQKHGILGQTITKYEQEAFAGIYDLIEKHYCPQSIMEALLVEKISTAYIKLFRLAKAEKEFMQSALNPTLDIEDEIEEGFVKSRGYTPTINVESIDKLQNIYGRYETTIENRLYKAMHELERIQRMRKGEKISAPVAVDVEVNEMGSFSEK